MRSFVQILGVLFSSAVFVACFHGAERDKEAPPGLPGGLCLGPDGHCDEGTCNQERNYCFDFADPCRGFFCGGEDRGFCSPDGDGQPTCTCEPPYNNEQYSLYCCPSPESGIFDPQCSTAGSITDDEPARH